MNVYFFSRHDAQAQMIAKVQAVKITCTLAVGDSSQNLIIY
jgi:hypothetical protein